MSDIDPNHPITVAPNPRRVTVVFNGYTIADTRQARTLREASLAPVQYIPRDDVQMNHLSAPTITRTARTKAMRRTTPSSPATRGRKTLCGHTSTPCPSRARWSASWRSIRTR